MSSRSGTACGPTPSRVSRAAQNGASSCAGTGICGTPARSPAEEVGEFGGRLPVGCVVRPPVAGDRHLLPPVGRLRDDAGGEAVHDRPPCPGVGAALHSCTPSGQAELTAQVAHRGCEEPVQGECAACAAVSNRAWVASETSWPASRRRAPRPVNGATSPWEPAVAIRMRTIPSLAPVPRPGRDATPRSHPHRRLHAEPLQDPPSAGRAWSERSRRHVRGLWPHPAYGPSSADRNNVAAHDFSGLTRARGAAPAAAEAGALGPGRRGKARRCPARRCRARRYPARWCRDRPCRDRRCRGRP